MSTATELRTTVTRLRCEHSFPCQPPHGSLHAPGRCSKCGMPWGDRVELAEPLREPLASLLEELADQMGATPCDKPDGACNGCERRDDFVHAFAVARAIASPAAALHKITNEGDPR